MNYYGKDSSEIMKDSFFNLRYFLENGIYLTSLWHRCDTEQEWTMKWEWAYDGECFECGIDIPKDLIRKWRMLLMVDEVIFDPTFRLDLTLKGKAEWYDPKR